ncbi:protein lin-37 homolog [Erpetoichthys calabaricus]|uniref:Lin-37 DREAM MuvB core complex component n=1 Tax=Erpetoichthys calabaricus TaxID=27687 RepID=A0A8C4T562_ERPCA|nr:protein lin-37 homolog [Erpetoichthys calabaricus]XP_051776466.1 protein lin-37 homolog [Erpetoichthys calabaricus]
MLNVKIKTEKTDLEAASARNRLDAVLQCLVEKTDSERDQTEDDSGKMVSDSHNKDLSPTTGGKRPSTRFSHHRRKKRKEMDDGLAEGTQSKPNAYVIKLFDRSVDLAQFNDNTPLYPICRAWMRNSPSVRERTRSPSPPTTFSEEEVADMLNGKAQNIYRMPPPSCCPVNPSGEPVNLRIPCPLPAPEKPVSSDLSESTPASLLYNHMERWKKIRQRWKEASNKNQMRYAESMKILKEMYERQ